MAKESIAKKRTTYLSLSLACRRGLYFIFTCFLNIFIAGYCDQHGKSATERSGSMSEESRGNPSRGSAETENTIINEDDEELRSELLQDVPEWLQDFKENLVDKNVQPHQYSQKFFSRLSNGVASKSGTGLWSKHSIYTHFPRDRKL